MRIVAGRYRGKAVKAPAGDSTRPTTDRVREALMSSLYSMRGGFEDAHVLDAFAGSGALGLEALSRGAGFVDFFEVDAKARACLEANIDNCAGARAQVAVHRSDAFKAAATCARTFDLVFLDPPYSTPAKDVAGLLAALQETGRLEPGAIVAYEHARKNGASLEELFAGLPLEGFQLRTYGKTGIALMRFAGGEGEEA